MNNATERIFRVFLALFAASTQYSKSASYWGQGVFPDDRQWHSPYKRKHIVNPSKETEQKGYKVCGTQECKKVAEEFLSSMNKSADPCEDFYEYSCGGWSSKHDIPPGLPSWSRIAIFERAVQHRVKGVLETPPEPSDILPVKQAKKWYRSCMDIENLEQRGMKPIESILMQAGGWPISMDEEEWSSEEYTWQTVDRHYARLTGSHALFKIQSHGAFYQSDFGLLRIIPPDMPLSEHFPMKQKSNYTGKDFDDYVQLIEDVAHLLVQQNRADVSKEKLGKEAREIVEFEKELFLLKNASHREPQTTFGNFVWWYDFNTTEVNPDPKAKIDWKTVIQELFDMVNINVSPSTDLNFRDQYITKIGELLKKTPARTIVNYVHWTFVGKMLMYTNELMRDRLSTYVKKELGVKGKLPRWSECVSEMKMGHAASYVFVNQYFTEPTKNAALVMIKKVRIEMEKQIENSNWLDEKSKEIIKDKLNDMKMYLGFPDWYMNDTAVINYHKGLTIGAEYFDNVLSYMKYVTKKGLKSLSTPANEDDPWQIDPITVNALYGPMENALTLPAVNFQAPLFTPQLPDAVNYGITGVTIGHELGHGFDDSGMELGTNGRPSSLSETILNSFFKRADCFTDQYDKYYLGTAIPKSDGTTPEYEGPPRLSILTRGENMADTTGIQAVFQAYRKLSELDGDSRLPGLEEFTGDQLFFLSFAAGWCEIETPEYEERQKASGDVHSPARLRVIGSVSNTQDFASVFHCSEGSAMNPSNKCNIWEKSESALKTKPGSRRWKHYPWVTHWDI